MMRMLLAGIVSMLAATIALAAASAQPAETLVTPNYKVVVFRHCPNTEVMCSKVSANVKSNDGRAYVLNRGSTYSAMAANGKANPALVPVLALKGYRFQHKKTEYLVLESGELTITRRGKLIANEQGSWSR